MSINVNKELTICSVYHTVHTRNCLEINLDLTDKLNPENNFTWIVVDNLLDETKKKPKHDNVLLIPGDGPNRSSTGGSIHHASGINKSIEPIKTRFALILDNDFYLLKPNWVNDIISHMKQYELSFFGVPWHPKWYTKYRYFPCVHCLFVDQDKIPLKAISFNPENDRRITHFAGVKNSIPSYLARVIQSKLIQVLTLRDRKSIGSSHDTGQAIYRLYGRDRSIRSETVVPVYHPKSDFQGPGYAPLMINRLFEIMLPDNWCFTPKAPGYFTETGFSELGYVDVNSKLWEEFIWRGQPFGFHIRGHQKKERGSNELKSIKMAIDNLT